MTGEQVVSPPIWVNPNLSYRYNDLTITFHPAGLNGSNGSIHRCGICAALVESSCFAIHTMWHERDAS